MGIYNNDLVLVAGMTLYDVDTKSIGILIRRFSTRESGFYDGIENYSIPYDTLCEIEHHITWAWDSVWSRDGRVIYTETGLLNLIKTGIVVIVDKNSKVL